VRILGNYGRMSRLLFVAAVVIGAAVAAPLASSKTAKTCKAVHPSINGLLLKSGVLTTIGEELPPWYTVNNGKLSGYDGDLMVAIAQMECLKLNVQEVNAVGVIPTIQSGRADIGGGNWYRTLTHEKVIYYTNPTHTDRMAIVSKDGVDTIAGLAGRQVGNLLGDTWTADVTAILGASNVHNYPSNQDIYQDLMAGRLDTSLFAYNGTSWYMKQGNLTGFVIKPVQPDPRVGVTLQPSQSGLMFSHADAKLGLIFDQDLNILKKEGKFAAFATAEGLPVSMTKTGPPAWQP
jgi:polar amino acid transport system substrate-binding protein